MHSYDPPTMTQTDVHTKPENVVQFASIRIIADDLDPLVRFYEVLTGADPHWLTDDFVELVTPSATVAISHSARVGFLGEVAPRAAANDSVIFEFLVEDVEALLPRLEAELGDGLTVVQGLTTMPWGNVSLLVRDPGGSIVNLYTPVTADAVELQRRRQPQPLSRQGT
jgi:catechol 2,3-dioxygenase-like lactoylglutathione lyase family enzyme